MYDGPLDDGEIFVTDKAHAMVMAIAVLPSAEGKKVDGGWVVPVSEDIMAELDACALDDETWSDTIERLLSTKM